VRVFDLVPFLDEVEVLRARIALLAEAPYEVVHVVAEGDRTHQGALRTPLLPDVDLPDNVYRFTVPLAEDADPWARERAQRDALADVARHGAVPPAAAPGDLVLSCDVDELVDPRALGSVLDATREGPARLGMRLFYYGLAWQAPTEWIHPVAMRAADLPRGGRTLSDMRTGGLVRQVVRGAGWHVSYWGGPARRRAKIEAFAHAEVREDRDMTRRVEAGGPADPHGWRLDPADLSGVHPLVIERLG
jgi:beta-1,4-mannosyl-glycoprotein beta-1,4-N-acetylglucosaminyltransferase